MHKVCKVENGVLKPRNLARKLSRSDSIIWAEQQLGSQRDLLREGPGRLTVARRASSCGARASVSCGDTAQRLPRPSSADGLPNAVGQSVVATAEIRQLSDD